MNETDDEESIKVDDESEVESGHGNTELEPKKEPENAPTDEEKLKGGVDEPGEVHDMSDRHSTVAMDRR
jgi:hypothetical protein